MPVAAPLVSFVVNAVAARTNAPVQNGLITFRVLAFIPIVAALALAIAVLACAPATPSGTDLSSCAIAKASPPMVYRCPDGRVVSK